MQIYFCLMKKRFVIIDAQALIHRAYHALPETLTNSQGEPTNALYGFSSVFLKMLADLKPDYIAAAFDRAEPTFRHQQFEEYKAHRPETPPALIEQVPKVKEMLKAFGVPVLEKAGFEADDIIGTLVEKYKKKPDLQILIVTGDLDTLQLIRENTQVYTLKRGITDTVTYGPKEVKERYGLTPKQLPDYKGLVGDASDNIPGVAGIGPKSASQLLSAYGTIEGIYRALNQGKITGRAASALKDSRDEALFSKELATIRTDAPIKFSLDKAAWSQARYNRAQVEKFFKSQGFRSLFNRLPGQPGPTRNQGKSKKFKTLSLKSQAKLGQALKDLKRGQEILVSFDQETLSFYTKGEQIFILNLNYNEMISQFLEQLISKGLLVSGWNLKKLARLVLNHSAAQGGQTPLGLKENSFLGDLSLLELGQDYQILAWLIKPSSSEPSLKGFAAFEPNLPENSPASASQLASVIAAQDNLLKQIKAAKLDRVYKKLEQPLIKALALMEHWGIKLNPKKLRKQSSRLENKLENLEKQAQALAGSFVNLNSPKQLRQLLYQRLKLPTEKIAKTPGGELSTDETELEKIKDKHPLVPLILEYRELAKLRNTYFDALPKFVAPDGRVHSQFLQTGTATGRLASRRPNLQNIPAQGPFAQKLRTAFQAPPGWVLASFDFSQIELRLAAHLSQDPILLEAFQKDQDIHALTASSIFNVSPGKVSPDQRRKAKVANFGVLYGLSAHGFAQEIGVSRSEAGEFIKAYFNRFQGLAAWIEAAKKQARRKGYAQTLLGRRRPLPALRLGSWRARAAAEREAVNFPIQGGVADLMKLAMIKIYERLIKPNYELRITSKDKKRGNSINGSLWDVSEIHNSLFAIRMLLQIHDELIFEIKKEKAPEYQKKITDIMENVYKLKVPLKVESAFGSNWAQLK